MYPPFGGPGFNGTYGNLGLYGALDPYGTLTLTAASPVQSFTEPITVAQARSYLNLPVRVPEDEDEVSTLNGLISGARAMAEILQGRDLVVKPWDLCYDYWPAFRIRLRPPVVSVDLVRYRDADGNYTTLAEDTDYVVDAAKRPGVLTPPCNKTWPTFTPWPSSAVLIRFQSGITSTDPFWSGPGARVLVGMKRLISDWFHNRLPFDVKAEDLPFGVSSCLGWGAVPRVK